MSQRIKDFATVCSSQWQIRVPQSERTPTWDLTLTKRLVFFSKKPVRFIWRILGSTVCGGMSATQLLGSSQSMNLYQSPGMSYVKPPFFIYSLTDTRCNMSDSPFFGEFQSFKNSCRLENIQFRSRCLYLMIFGNLWFKGLKLTSLPSSCSMT